MNDLENKIFENLSGDALGSLCAYIREFGSPHQIHHIKDMISNIVSDEAQELSTEDKPKKKSKEAATSDVVPNWKILRQRAYELAGDWLWTHAVNHYRMNIASHKQIPNVLLDKVLSVDPVKDGYGLFQLLPPQEVLDATNTNAKTVRKSHRNKKRNRNYDDGNDEDLFAATNGTASVGNDTMTTVATCNLGDHEIEGLDEYFDTDSVSTANAKKKQKTLVEEEKNVDVPPSVITSTAGYVGVSNTEDGSFSASYKTVPIGSFTTAREAAIAVDFCVLILSLLGINDTSQSMNIATLETWGSTLESKYLDTLQQIQHRLDTNTRRKNQIISDIDDSILKQIIQAEVDVWVKGNTGADKVPTDEVDNPTIFTALLSAQSTDSIQQLNCICKTIQTSPYVWIPFLYYLLFIYPTSPSEYNTHPNCSKLLHKICIYSCKILHFILRSRKSSLIWREYNSEEQKVIVALISICKLSDNDETGTSQISCPSTLLLSSTYALANLIQEVNPPYPILNYIISVIPQLQKNEESASNNRIVSDQLLKNSETIVPITQTWIHKFLKNKDISPSDKDCMGLDDSKSVIGELAYMHFLKYIQNNQD